MDQSKSVPSEADLTSSFYDDLNRKNQTSVQTLPMVVWLRGDEDHCDQFSLDADTVMEKLGIRRSRLTQISGRELRVGRIRKGRYIVPVYRPEDVTEYQEWTRAPATHIKSSSLVHEAADSLRQTGEDLAERFEDALLNLASSMDHAVQKGSIAASKNTIPILNELLRTTEKVTSQVDHVNRILSQSTQSLTERLQNQQQTIEMLKTCAAMLTKDMTELTGLTRLVIDEGRKHYQDLAEVLTRCEEKLLQEDASIDSPLPKPWPKTRSLAHARRLAHMNEISSPHKPVTKVNRVRTASKQRFS